MKDNRACFIYTGSPGDTGSRNTAGQKGAQGASGETGDVGAKGVPGLPGSKGQKGDMGPPGDNIVDSCLENSCAAGSQCSSTSMIRRCTCEEGYEYDYTSDECKG